MIPATTVMPVLTRMAIFRVRASMASPYCLPAGPPAGRSLSVLNLAAVDAAGLEPTRALVAGDQNSPDGCSRAGPQSSFRRRRLRWRRRDQDVVARPHSRD